MVNFGGHFFLFFLAILFFLKQGRNLQQNILIEFFFWQNDENSPPKISLPGLKHGVLFGAKFRQMAISFFPLKVAKNLVFFRNCSRQISKKYFKT